MKMADGYNAARAMRISEIITDFREIMTYISSVNATPPSHEVPNGAGFVVLGQCRSDARTILAQPFQSMTAANGNTEQQKTDLRRIIADAAVRRFRAQKLYMRATAALRWVNQRAAMLRGQPPNPQLAPMLSRIDDTFRSELSAITDQRIYQMLRSKDDQDHKWTAEDPSLDTLQRLLAASGA